MPRHIISQSPNAFSLPPNAGMMTPEEWTARPGTRMIDMGKGTLLFHVGARLHLSHTPSKQVSPNDATSCRVVQQATNYFLRPSCALPCCYCILCITSSPLHIAVSVYPLAGSCEVLLAVVDGLPGHFQSTFLLFSLLTTLLTLV